MSSHQNKSFIFLWTVNRFKLLELSAIFMFLGVSKHVSTVYILPMQNVKKTSRLKGVQGHHEPSETASLASLYIIRRITSKPCKTFSMPLDTSSSLCYSVSALCNFYRVSNVIDYSLSQNYMQLRRREIISRNFYNLISRNFVMITRNKWNYNLAKLRQNFA